MSPRAPSLDAERSSTNERQSRAADPGASVWVSANAGTGKTHVLTMRVLRLLLAGTRPERLLCLTYTKAAAAQMSNRVFKRLADWVTMEDAKLVEALRALLGRAPEPAELGRARDLFTAAIETPGGLKVQTIHAFCERLLQRFPLEAGVPPGFTILDDEQQSTLVGEATHVVLALATAEPGSKLGRALDTVIRFASDDSFDGLLAEALGKRDWLEEAGRVGQGDRPPRDVAMLYREQLGLGARETAASITAARAAVLKPAQIGAARDVLRTGSSSDVKLVEPLAAALAASSDAARAAALAAFFLTKGGEPRARLMTKKLATDHAELLAALEVAQGQFAGLTERLGRIAVADATVAVVELAAAVMQRYTDAKRQRAALDFDDLIRAAGSLLGDSTDTQWVLYKLDGGLDHILVDEAQDTSPTQWRVIEALAKEFFSGAGSRQAEGLPPRTVFAVGDEKQSIYGFQGAAPKMFADMGTRFESLARAARQQFARVPLTLSFRTVAPVLQAVDQVFRHDVRGQGLTYGGAYHAHVANRAGQGGTVEIWDTEKPDDAEPSPAWQPLDETAQSPPADRLAERIALTIDGWIGSGARLVSEDRPITYGDILVLVRRRRPFADLMVSALKKRRIPVAGADRLQLSAQLAVKDVMAMFDVLLLPEDDLSLAAVLKSPLIGLDDDDLIALAPARRGSLWSALLKAADTSPRFRQAAEQLKRWRSRADVAPPYEFLVEVLIHDGMRTRLLSRLGAEAADAIDELVSLALSYDDRAPPSLQGFMSWLRASERDIKRDMEHGRNEVRVMTVHGSKGLEAPIVFLADTCSGPGAGRRGGLVGFPAIQRPESDAAEPFLWAIKGSAGVAAIAEARDAIRTRETEEHNRLLYVALTRARDRLYVAGFEGGRAREKSNWYDAVEQGLADIAGKTAGQDGAPTVRRLEAPQTAAAEQPQDEAHEVVPPESPPEWARHPAPREPGLAIPLAPSRLAPLDTDADGEPIEKPRPAAEVATDEPPAPSPATLAGANRFLRGTITHALLQHLPGLPDAGRKAAAEAFVAARAGALSAAARRSIVAETLAVLTHPDFADVFGPGSRAEVPLVARLPRPDGRGQPIHLTGQLDRLVVRDHDCLIVDFKTNRPPPQEIADVPQAYVLQLAAYRLALARIYPGLAVRAALLWTDGPRLMELPAERLDLAAEQLFKLDRASLDA